MFERYAKKWTPSLLDKMREVGDPYADEVVAKVFDSTDPCSAWGLMMQLDREEGADSTRLPPVLQEYLRKTDAILKQAEPETVGGHWLYKNYSPEIFFILAVYSLPAAYAAAKGVKVLHRTTLIEKRPDTRLAQTARIVENILKRDGIRPGAQGMRSIQKVRLIHAAIRFLILHDQKNKWKAELGVPVNQEDLAGTLMVFSYLILDGLRKLGITIPKKHQQGFIETWGVIGRLMGIQDELIPATVKEAKALCNIIQRRQVHTSEEGIFAAHALLKVLEEQAGIAFQRWPAASMRFFLPRKVAKGFGIPIYWFEESALYLVRIFDRLFRRDNPLRLPFVRHIGKQLVDQFIDANTAPYKLPTTLMGKPDQFRNIPC